MTTKYSLFNFFIAIFCFLTMFVPDSYQVIRLGLLCILLLLSFFDRSTINSYVDSLGLFILLMVLAYNMFCCALGAARNAPGAYRVITAELFWPLFFSFIGIRVANKFSISRICKFLIHIEVFLVIWDLWYCLGELKIIPFPSIFKAVDLNYMFGKFGFFIQFSTTHMVTHIFMIPFTMAYCGYSKNKKFYVLVVLMQMFLVSISGRAALILISYAFLGISLLKFLRAKSSFFVKILKLLFILGLISGLVYLASTEVANGVIEYVSNKTVNSFSDTGHVDSTRYYQNKYLLDGWQRHIFLGNGSGSYDSRIVRDKEHPWFYELAYHAFLYQKGLIWLFTFILQLSYIFLGLKKLKKENPLYNCFIYGLFAILIANSVDPYLNKFGCLWMLYLPFVIVLCNTEPFIFRPKKGTKLIFQAVNRRKI